MPLFQGFLLFPLILGIWMLGSRANREGTSPVPSPPLGWVFDGNFVVWDAL